MRCRYSQRRCPCLAASRPDLVRGMVLCGVPLLRPSKAAKPPVTYRLGRKAHQAGLLSDRRFEAMRRARASDDYNAASGVMRNVLVRVVNESYEAQLRAVACPVALLWGSADQAVPASTIEQARGLLTALVDTEIVDGAGHDVQHLLEQGRGFLRRRRRARGGELPGRHPDRFRASFRGPWVGQSSPLYAAAALAEPFLKGWDDINIAPRTWPQHQLPAIERPIRRSGPLLSYQDKYVPEEGMAGAARELPAALAEDVAATVVAQATAIMKAAAVRGVARLDFMTDGAKVLVNEINTIPGSLARYLWIAPEIPFIRQLCDLIEEAAARPAYQPVLAGADGRLLGSAASAAAKLA